MSKEIELEVKVLLNYKSYVRLLRYFNLDTVAPIVQINYYFDTPDFTLNQMKAVLRVREVGNNYTLTIKTQLEEGVLEINETITPAVFNAMIEGGNFKKGEVYDKLNELKINAKELIYINSLTTKRHQFTYNDGEDNGRICLDCNTYGDYIDYELEFESDHSIAKGKTIVAKIMGEIGQPFAFNDLSKIARMFNATVK